MVKGAQAAAVNSLFALICILGQVGAADAGTTVDGFFTEDYVTSGHFTGQDSTPINTEVGTSASGASAAGTSPAGTYPSGGGDAQTTGQNDYWKTRKTYQPAAAATKPRMYPGRFVKSMRGTQRSKVQGEPNEWDVKGESSY